MRIAIFYLLFFMANAVFSQNSRQISEREYLYLQQKFKSTVYSNVDSAFIYVDRMEKSENPMHKAFALGSKAYLLQNIAKSSESKKVYAQSLEYLNKVPESRKKIELNAYLLNMGGLIDWKRTDYSKALLKYHKGITLSQKINDYPQVLKFLSNIALINGDIGNFKLAISASREALKGVEKNRDMYIVEQFENEKAIIYYNLGSFYEKSYHRNKTKHQLLDSAEYFYKNTILFSKDAAGRKMGAQINLANLYYLSKEYVKAEKVYYDLLSVAKENALVSQYYTINYNLGHLYYDTKRYDDALTCFQKVDSIFNLTKTDEAQFIYANYFQAKIYTGYKDTEKASYHSKICEDAYEKHESKLNNESMEANYVLGSINLEKEIRDIREKNKNAKFLRNAQIFFVVAVFIILLFILFRNIRKRKGVEEKISTLIAEHKASMESKNSLEELYSVKVPHEDKTSQLSIDEEKEDEIIKKLIQLEKKRQFLNADFTQQAVAKKIKTNTTYLSYVVNKRFGKTFSEYVNELKINYVINEMILNPTFRKYSTQAMAESIGYKNAVSFTKTFSKRTGVTPVQFIKKLETDSLN